MPRKKATQQSVSPQAAESIQDEQDISTPEELDDNVLVFILSVVFRAALIATGNESADNFRAAGKKAAEETIEDFKEVIAQARKDQRLP